MTMLLESKHESIKNLEISVLVRCEEKGKILAQHGVKPIYFNDFNDSEAITKAASEHDSKVISRFLHQILTNYAQLLSILPPVSVLALQGP